MKIITKYLNHVKEQDEQIKIMHAFLFSILMTLFFSIIYLYLVRGVSPPKPEILKAEEVFYKANN